MKTRKICTTTLATILGVTVLGAASPAFAAPTELNSTGTVSVQEGTIGPDDPTPDPENPDTPIPTNPDIPVNPDSGSLIIQRVSNLNFGAIKTSTSAVTANATPITLSAGETRGAIVGWSDVRAGGTYGYNITAELTKQFTDSTGSNVLTGSTIDFTNGIVATPSENTNVAPSTVTPAIQLASGAGAVNVVTADATKLEGKGSYVLEFGQSANYKGTAGTAGTDKTAVQLTVPASTASNMAVADYTATITWKIAATPTPAA